MRMQCGDCGRGAWSGEYLRTPSTAMDEDYERKGSIYRTCLCRWRDVEVKFVGWERAIGDVCVGLYIVDGHEELKLN